MLWVVALVLAALSFAAYLPSLDSEFINWDDNKYVTENPQVQQGLTWSTVKWAFGTSFVASNWHPLTWLSHGADVEIFGGDNARGHHLTNILLHAINTGLLAIALFYLTGRLWPSAVVAALFALHPLHVESVAWVAERKDVLSTMLMFLALWAYAAYVRRPSWRRYALIVLTMVLSLLSKPMAVTLPCMLLLLDAWPLGRLSWRTVWEKVPLFALSTASCVMTFIAQHSGGATRDLETLRATTRVIHAVYAYTMYLVKTAFPWPGTLLPYYPLPDRGGPTMDMVIIAGFALILVGATALALQQWRKRPYLLVGWLIYLGMLVPVIGLVQVGKQIMADRYMYIPAIGLFVAAVWLVAEAVAHSRRLRHGAAVATLVVLATFGGLTWQQQQIWGESETFWLHVVEVYPQSSTANNQLGRIYTGRGDAEKAIEYYQKAVDVAFDDSRPGRITGNPMAHTNLANRLRDVKRYDEARHHYKLAIKINPKYGKAYNGMGALLHDQGDLDGALQYLTKAVELLQNNAECRHNLALVLRRKALALEGEGRNAKAQECLKKAAQLERPTKR